MSKVFDVEIYLSTLETKDKRIIRNKKNTKVLFICPVCDEIKLIHTSQLKGKKKIFCQCGSEMIRDNG
jgi:transcription elongation factor Elf1